MRVSVIMVYKLFDFGDEFFDTPKCSAANGPLGDEMKPSFHLVQPRTISGCIVNLVPRVECEPAFNFGMLMGGVVIDH